MKIFNKLNCLCAVLLILAWASCKVEKAKIVSESSKDITGTWQIIRAVRNGTDITNAFGVDLTPFTIQFKGNSYTISNRVPFIVDTLGTYSLDDPQIPASITFNPVGAKAVASSFYYPIVSGARNIQLTFSANADCNANQYIYTLRQVNQK